MIANSNVKAHLPRLGWILLAFLATTLLLIPTRAQERLAPTFTPGPAIAPVGSIPKDPRINIDRRLLVKAVEPPAFRLAGFWSTEVSWRVRSSTDRRRLYQVEKGVAAFSFNLGKQWHPGLMINEGDQLPRRVKLRLTKHDDDLWIDLVEEGGEKLLGICELADDNASARFAFLVPPNGAPSTRPKSFKQADAKNLHIVELKRIGNTKKSPAATEYGSVPLPQNAPAIPPGRRQPLTYIPTLPQIGVGVNSDASVIGTVVIDERNCGIVSQDPAGRKSKDKVVPLQKIEGELNDNLVVASVNGTEILLEDVLHQVAKNLARTREDLAPGRFRRLQEKLLRQGLPKHIDRLLLVHAFRAEFSDERWAAFRRQLISSFEKEIERLKNKHDVTSCKELKSELIRQGTTLRIIRNAYEQTMINQQYLRDRTGNGEKTLDRAAFEKLMSELRKTLRVHTVFDDSNGS